MNSREWVQRLPLIFLISVVVLITAWDWTHSLWSWWAVPADITTAFEQVKGGEFSRRSVSELLPLLGCAFLHADAGHIASNVLFLWIFGAVVLDLCGWRWLWFIFLTTAIGATTTQVLLDPYSEVPVIGASGAVTGFQGAYLAMVIRQPRPDPHVWPMAHPIPPMHLAGLGFVFVMLDLSGIVGGAQSNIAYGAHVGGFVSGIFVALLRKE